MTAARSMRLASFALMAAVGVSAAAWAAPAEQPPPGVMPQDMHGWIKRIQESTLRRSFTGTFVVNAGGAMSSARIAHHCDGRSQIERVDALDGQQRRLYRHNEVVHVLWPTTREAVVEQRFDAAGFPALMRDADPALAMPYEVSVQGMDRVAGHDAHVLLFKPRDSLRFAQRLWTEKGTGLLLRADVLAGNGEVIESSAFSELVIGPRVKAAALVQEMNRLDGYRVARPVFERTELEREGWSLRAPAGFALVRCVKRPPAAGAGAAQTGAASMLQTVYSDGMSQVSVFIEPLGGVERSRSPSASGATHAVSAPHGDWWVTAVGDVPLATLRQFIAGLQRRDAAKP
jgi:sigma-E factor negative regulatory protein RseB